MKVYHIDVDGRLRLIYPNRYSPGGFVKANSAILIPDFDDPYAFVVGPPYGTEFIKVVASTERFSNFEESMVDLGSADQALHAGSVTAAPLEGEQAEALAMVILTAR